VSIGHRGYLILEALLDASGETVSKTTLLEHAWPGLVVEEANLTVQVGALRKAMGADGETLIVTVPRAGYRLVRSLQAPAAMPPAPAVATIAVMPFANLSENAEQEYFADGMVDELITALSRFKSFAVVSRTSTFAYKHKTTDIREAARQLGVRYVVEGSVRRAGERLRVTAQLIDSATGAHLWAEKFDGATSDVFAFQDAITEGVIGFVEPTIRKAEIDRARRKPPESLEAYDLFLEALPLVYGMEAAQYLEALVLLERAAALDPTLELGGKSPNIFFDDVASKDDDFFDKALEGFVMFALNQGEVCTCPSRAFIQESIYDKFMERALKRVDAIVQGSPLDPNTMIGAQASSEQMEKILSYFDIGRKEGAEILIGGERNMLDGPYAGGYYIKPTILKGHNKMRVFQEEIFGPVVSVTTFKTDEEALSIANDTLYGLGAGVWSRDANRCYRFGRAIQAGRVWTNCYHAYPAHAAFGGYKQSGVGRENHKMMLDHYQQTKNMLVSYSPKKLGFF
jgi:TolB-like protein